MGTLLSNLIFPLEAEPQDVLRHTAKLCGVPFHSFQGQIYRRSVDARGGRICMVYTVETDAPSAADLPGARSHVRSSLSEILCNKNPLPGNPRPIVIGFGPGGMFAALCLARVGANPIVLERGPALEQRNAAVDTFHRTRVLDENGNIQFGEGGAGTYSDGKLTTRINDPYCEAVLDTLCEMGAPKEILTDAMPHIGTDLLRNVVRNIRQEIIRLGGEVHFEEQVTGFRIQNGVLKSVITPKATYDTNRAILAIGHSARDTFRMLLHQGVTLLPKNFAMGVRIEHRQEEIDSALYGKYAGHTKLGAASYRVSHRENGRGCFSFCMCPGGEISAAASSAGTVVTNGMSHHARSGENGNSALAIGVDTASLGRGPLAGLELAERLEKAAFDAGGGDYTAPTQLVADFLANRPSTKGGRVKPTYPLGVNYTAIDALLPPGGGELLRTSLQKFAVQFRFFRDGDAVLTAPETRTSSPVRILRNEKWFSDQAVGLIPCGEGAGYAGGIMSAAVDGIRSAIRLLDA